MTFRGVVFAESLSDMIREMRNLLEPLSPEQWRRTCSAEGWPVGLVAYHIALGMERQSGWIENALADGPPRPFSWAETDELNAAVARAAILPSKPFVLASLNAAADRVCDLLRRMSDSDVDRAALSYDGKPLSLQATMKVFIRHIDDHSASIRKAVAD